MHIPHVILPQSHTYCTAAPQSTYTIHKDIVFFPWFIKTVLKHACQSTLTIPYNGFLKKRIGDDDECFNFCERLKSNYAHRAHSWKRHNQTKSLLK